MSTCQTRCMWQGIVIMAADEPRSDEPGGESGPGAGRASSGNSRRDAMASSPRRQARARGERLPSITFSLFSAVLSVSSLLPLMLLYCTGRLQQSSGRSPSRKRALIISAVVSSCSLSSFCCAAPEGVHEEYRPRAAAVRVLCTEATFQAYRQTDIDRRSDTYTRIYIYIRMHTYLYVYEI